MNLLLAMLVPERLVHLSAVDYAIIVFYFGLVIAIGWYLKGRANTGVGLAPFQPCCFSRW